MYKKIIAVGSIAIIIIAICMANTRKAETKANIPATKPVKKTETAKPVKTQVLFWIVS